MKYFLNKINSYAPKVTKTLVLFSLVVLMVVGPLAIPKQADAQFVDWINNAWNVLSNGLFNTIANVATDVIGKALGALEIKEFSLDAIAWAMVNILLEAILRETIDWVNRGFDGSPTFLTNPEAFFTDLVDLEVGKFIFENPNLNFLCTPYTVSIRFALQKSRSDRKRYQCTLTRVITNFENFTDSLNNLFRVSNPSWGGGGWQGWEAWNALAFDNVYNRLYETEADLSLRINGKLRWQQELIKLSNGVFSLPDCTQLGAPVFGGRVAGDGREGAAEVNVHWTDCPLATPGIVVQKALTESLNIPTGRLTVADEINELIGALMGQLLNTMMQKGVGLLGLSTPNSRYGGRSYTESLGEASQNQFGDIRARTAQELEDDIDIQERYIAAKERGLGGVNESISLLNALIACERATLLRATSTPQDIVRANTAIASASSTIQEINSRIAPTRNDISITEGFLAELQSIRDTLDSFSLDDITRSLFDFNDVQSQYLNLRSRIRTESDVTAAESGNSGNIGIDLQAINNDTQVKLDQCRGIETVGSAPIPDSI